MKNRSCACCGAALDILQQERADRWCEDKCRQKYLRRWRDENIAAQPPMPPPLGEAVRRTANECKHCERYEDRYFCECYSPAESVVRELHEIIRHIHANDGSRYTLTLGGARYYMERIEGEETRARAAILIEAMETALTDPEVWQSRPLTARQLAAEAAERAMEKFAHAIFGRGWLEITFDATARGVRVPKRLRGREEVTFIFGFDLPIPIPDLFVDATGISGTLSFKGRPYPCYVPWTAVYDLERIVNESESSEVDHALAG